MAGTLRSRLARARERTQAVRESRSHGLKEAPGPEGTSPLGQLSGWSPLAPFVLTRRLRRGNPLPETLDLRPYLSRASRFSPVESERNSSSSIPDLRFIPADRLLFLDLETTGLSGGAGTIAFLAGLGRVIPGGFEICQFLLTDYPGEDDFLDAVLSELGPGTVLASYNGRSFDEPLLRTRCILNRKLWPPHPHADFLPAARRLWRKRFPDCSLGTLEALVLKRQRSLDVPGARIPEIWFEYAKRGSHPLMEAVLEHNAADVESLAAIAAECARTHANPLDARDCDRTALGALWLKLHPDTGRAVLEQVFGEGEDRAGWLLLRHYRRNGIWAEYRRILSALSPGWESWIERAKDAEHRLGDPRAALQAARSAGAFVPDTALKENLEHRIRRLIRKAAAIQLREGHTSLPR